MKGRLKTMRIKRGAVGRNARRQIQARKAEQREVFSILYGKPKEKAFSDIDQLNMDSFRAIPKDIISYGLSKAALAVYPVLCSEADFEKDESFQISQANIAFLAGVSGNSVRKSLKELEDTGLLTREKVTDGSRHFYIYRVNFFRKSILDMAKQRGGAIYFYTSIIKNGIWASLPLGAKATYLYLRTEAKQDLFTYCEIEIDEWYDPIQYPEYIRDRKWDICETSLNEICTAVGIDRSDIYASLESLEHFRLIERIDKWIKVYLRPGRFLRH
jgi:predicted transcriptional regulator